MRGRREALPMHSGIEVVSVAAPHELDRRSPYFKSYSSDQPRTDGAVRIKTLHSLSALPFTKRAASSLFSLAESILSGGSLPSQIQSNRDSNPGCRQTPPSIRETTSPLSAAILHTSIAALASRRMETLPRRLKKSEAESYNLARSTVIFRFPFRAPAARPPHLS